MSISRTCGIGRKGGISLFVVHTSLCRRKVSRKDINSQLQILNYSSHVSPNINTLADSKKFKREKNLNFFASENHEF